MTITLEANAHGGEDHGETKTPVVSAGAGMVTRVARIGDYEVQVRSTNLVVFLKLLKRGSLWPGVADDAFHAVALRHWGLLVVVRVWIDHFQMFFCVRSVRKWDG